MQKKLFLLQFCGGKKQNFFESPQSPPYASPKNIFVIYGTFFKGAVFIKGIFSIRSFRCWNFNFSWNARAAFLPSYQALNITGHIFPGDVSTRRAERFRVSSSRVITNGAILSFYYVIWHRTRDEDRLPVVSLPGKMKRFLI